MIEKVNPSHPDKVADDKAYAALIDLVTDICQRNGIKKLVWSTDKNTRVNHLNGANMTVHRDYANKSCPGDCLYNRHGDIAAAVNARLGASGTTDTSTATTLYRVRKIWADSKTQIGAYKVLANAKKAADENAGYSVFDGDGNVVYAGSQTAADTGTSFTPYKVQVTITDLNIRTGPGTNYAKTGQFTGKGVFTIVDESSGAGSDKGWGKLKSGAGWISLEHCTKI